MTTPDAKPLTNERIDAIKENLRTVRDQPMTEWNVGCKCGDVRICDDVESLLAALRAAEAERDKLTEALGMLRDHQNGCPLPSYEKGWTKAMELAEAALAAAGERG